MIKKYIPLTYLPKILPVQAGKIRQTIRVNSKIHWSVGDLVAFHGWSGRPYFDPWSFRTEFSPVVFAEDIVLTDTGILWPCDIMWEWDSQFCDTLAILDGIEGGTGRELKKVLEGYHGYLKFSDKKGQVIRW